MVAAVRVHKPGGPEALVALKGAYPGLDEAEWQRRIEAARTERERTNASGAAARELFRALRELTDPNP